MGKSQELLVLPMNQVVELKPGETYSGYISVGNVAGEDGAELNYNIYVAPYSVISEEYDVDVVTMTDRTQMVNWIKIAESIGTLTQNETKKVQFTIEVPESAPAGGQYAAIIVSAENEAGASNMIVQNTMGIASVIYARVAGEIVHDGKVLENNIPGFSAIAPVTVSALISNNGNVHEEAEISITVTDFLTGEVIFPTETKSGGIYTEIVMPGTNKVVNRTISDLPLLGIVNVKQSIYYNYAIYTEEKNVVICPIWFIVLVLITIAAIVSVIVGMIRKHRRTRLVVE